MWIHFAFVRNHQLNVVNLHYYYTVMYIHVYMYIYYYNIWTPLVQVLTITLHQLFEIGVHVYHY